MHKHGDEYSKDDVLAILKQNPDGQPPLEWFEKCIDFHTYPAPGILIGLYMVDYALSLLNAKPTEKLYGIAESQKCIPDALQVITNCTIGNNRLRIISTGRFAICMNRASEAETAEGVRICMNPASLHDTPALQAWFANSKDFDKKTMSKQVVTDILKKGRKMLLCEKVRIPIIPKEKWDTGVCSSCGEHIPSYMLEGDICPGCGSLKYFERVE